MQLRDASSNWLFRKKWWISSFGIILHACVDWFQQQVVMTDAHTSTRPTGLLSPNSHKMAP